MGDDRVFTHTITNSDNMESISYSHTYSVSAVSVTVTFTVSNLVGSVVLNATIEMQEAIGSGSLTALNSEVLVNEETRFQLTLNSRYFVTNVGSNFFIDNLYIIGIFFSKTLLIT